MSACGTPRGLESHKRRNERPCKWCLPLMPEPTAKKKRGPAPGTRPMGRPLQPCGTDAAYWRHKNHGEEVCDPCGQAHRDYNNARAQRKRAAKEG